MTYLHFIVYVLCLSTASMTYFWFKAFCKIIDLGREIKQLGNISRGNIDSYINGAISIKIDEITKANKSKFNELENECIKRALREAKFEIQSLWEKQFFMSKDKE